MAMLSPKLLGHREVQTGYGFNSLTFNTLNVKNGKAVFKYTEARMSRKLVILAKILTALNYFKNTVRMYIRVLYVVLYIISIIYYIEYVIFWIFLYVIFIYIVKFINIIY